MDAQILLAKLCYAEHKFEEALNFYSKAGLDNLTEKALPLRSLRMIAEAYSIKGMQFCHLLMSMNSMCATKLRIAWYDLYLQI